MNTINYKNILSPEKGISTILEQMIPKYSEEYGSSFRSVIEKHFLECVFIFDSLPEEKIRFFQKSFGNIPIKAYSDCFFEYIDYLNAEKKIDQDIWDEFSDSVFGTVSSSKKELFSLDFDSFSLDSIMFSKDSERSQSIKERQDAYWSKCLELDVFPIMNWQEIDRILALRKQLLKQKQIKLLQSTIWGKRMMEKLHQKGFQVSEETAAMILFDRSVAASTNVVLDDLGNPKIVCFVPFFSGSNVLYLDRILFHEFRHIAEMHLKGTGLVSFADPKYDLLNEIRCDYHALRDYQSFSNAVFSRSSSKSAYERYFPEYESFLKEHEAILDFLAMHDDVSLEEIFGEEVLKIVKASPKVYKNE